MDHFVFACEAFLVISIKNVVLRELPYAATLHVDIIVYGTRLKKSTPLATWVLLCPTTAILMRKAAATLTRISSRTWQNPQQYLQGLNKYSSSQHENLANIHAARKKLSSFLMRCLRSICVVTWGTRSTTRSFFLATAAYSSLFSNLKRRLLPSLSHN